MSFLYYSDKKSSIDELLDLDGTVSIQHQNIKLGIQIFEIVQSKIPEIMKQNFHARDEALIK